MCILMVIHRLLPDYPIIVAANRDETYDRPTQGPALLCDAPRIWGGRDERAGGTWMGVNEHGVVVGLTNRRLDAEQEADPERRSRGMVCLEALQGRSAAKRRHPSRPSRPNVITPSICWPWTAPI